MKIKIVVRPEDEQKAAAEAARQARQKRGRWGIAALLGLMALSAAIAFFFIGRGTPPDDPGEPPVASAPGSTAAIVIFHNIAYAANVTKRDVLPGAPLAPP